MSSDVNMPLRFLLGVKQPGTANRIIVWDTEEVTIGRGPDNDLIVEHDEASRNHAVLFRNPSGHYVRDLRTANGTRVNDEPLVEDRRLDIRDAIAIGDADITFISTRKDPGASGMEVVHASQLKKFQAPKSDAPPDATMMSLGDLDDPGQAEFAVDPVGSFGMDDAPAAPRDLDAELSGDRVSLQIEIDGLTPDLRRLLLGLADKTIELPSLRIRVKGDDLD